MADCPEKMIWGLAGVGAAEGIFDMGEMMSGSFHELGQTGKRIEGGL